MNREAHNGITGTTAVVGVMGFPVAHSLSPPMQNAAFAALGLDWVYVPFAVAPENLPAAVAAVTALGLRGVNLTIPHKAAVLPLLDRVTPAAAAIGSVNTLAVTPDGLLGHSTDGPGFLRALTERGFMPAGTSVVVLGTGGAARAVVGALAQAGVTRITVAARHPDRAAPLRDVAARLAPAPVAVAIHPWDAPAVATALTEAQLLVNATSVGMAPKIAQSPVPTGWLHPELWVYDLVYTPRRTALLCAAAQVGCPVVDGTAMLVHQGAEAFTLWTGCEAPIAVMEAALLAALAST